MASSSPLPGAPPPDPTPQELAPEKPALELSAPSGWQKKIASTKTGATPLRGAVYFVAPDGLEIKSKRSLDMYLRRHPDGPSFAEFDWSTGDTPRRSSRLSAISRPTQDTSESGPSGKRQKRKKVAKEDEASKKGAEEVEMHMSGDANLKTGEVVEAGSSGKSQKKRKLRKDDEAPEKEMEVAIKPKEDEASIKEVEVATETHVPSDAKLKTGETVETNLTKTEGRGEVAETDPTKTDVKMDDTEESAQLEPVVPHSEVKLENETGVLENIVEQKSEATVEDVHMEAKDEHMKEVEQPGILEASPSNVPSFEEKRGTDPAGVVDRLFQDEDDNRHLTSPGEEASLPQEQKEEDVKLSNGFSHFSDSQTTGRPVDVNL